jgi:hypothetical protein
MSILVIVAMVALKDSILQSRKNRVKGSFNLLVEFAYVISHPDGTIFLWANKTGHAPFCVIYMEAEAK